MEQTTRGQSLVVSYVTADGTYGTGDIVLFHDSGLTDDQWEFMTEMRDNDRFSYVSAVLSGDLETVAQYHAEYEDQ